MSRSAGLPLAAAATLAACAALALAAGCRRQAPSSGDGAAGDSGPVLALLNEQRYDEAIARVGERADPESLYLLGLAWAGKARSAPLPTPAPGAPDAAPKWKPEERRALDFLERAVAGRPDHAGAHRAIAELIAPHALERVEAGRTGRPARADDEGTDASVERVLRQFEEAVQADPEGTVAAEGLIRFATAAGRPAEADAAYQELLHRRREDAALLVRYGDFLVAVKHDQDAALSQYAQALMWHPDDGATRLKVAEIHLRTAAEHLKQHEYVAAEARLKDARRAGVDPASPQAARLRELEQVLHDIRGR